MKFNGTIQLTPADLKAIDDAIAYINENYAKAITAEDLSMRFSIRTLELHEGIKRKTTASLHSYLTEVRISKAKEFLLSDLAAPIKHIAALVGYKKQSHFGEVFKSLVGRTPQEYRLSADPLKGNA